MMKLPAYVPNPRNKKIINEMREGLTYLKNATNIKFVISMLALMSLIVLPFTTLLPVYAKDIFHGTASTFGIIDSAIGLGAFSGAIFLASLKPGSNLNRILAINTFVFGLGLIFFSHSTHYPLALTFITIGAFGMMSQVTITNTLVQTSVDPAMRGRVISIYAMAFFGMQPLGGLIVGALSQHIGVQTTLLGEGIIALIIGLFHVRFLYKHNLLHSKRISTENQPVETAKQV